MSLLWGHSVYTRTVGLSSPCCTHSPSSRGWWAGTLSTWTRGSYQSWCNHGLDSHPPAGRRTPTDNACNSIRKRELAKVLLDIIHYLRYVWCVMYYFLGLGSICLQVIGCHYAEKPVIIFSLVPFLRKRVYGCCMMVFSPAKEPHHFDE